MARAARARAGTAPSMADVARAAGVSAQTVSRVLGGRGRASAETVQRIHDAVARLGYRRNDAARMLASGRTRRIGVVRLQTGSYSSGATGVGIELAADHAGYSVVTASAPTLDAADVEGALSQLADRGVEGIVLAVPLVAVSPGIERLTGRIPTVAVDGSRTASTEVVSVSQHLTGELATRHLLDLGHATVHHVGGPPEWRDAARRADGWRTALEASGRTVPPVLHGDWTPRSGYERGLTLGGTPGATAVFVASDEMAFGVIRAFRELGRRIPEDVSVVGVDDIALAEFCVPPLTTVAQPFEHIGRSAVEHLVRLIEDPAAEPHASTAEPHLVVRASTAPPPSAASAG